MANAQPQVSPGMMVKYVGPGATGAAAAAAGLPPPPILNADVVAVAAAAASVTLRVYGPTGSVLGVQSGITWADPNTYDQPYSRTPGTWFL